MITLSGLLIFFTSILVWAFVWMKTRYSYWERKKVPYFKPTLLFGNLKDLTLFKKSAATGLQDLYSDKTAKNEPFVGMFSFFTPVLLIRDLELIKRMLIKDANFFSNRFSYSDPHTDILGGNALFFRKNPEWKQIRSSISPVFTSGRMKQMFPLVIKVGKELDEHLLGLTRNAEAKTVCLEIRDICALFTTDVIASVAFGIEADSIRNPNGEFRTNGKAIFDFNLFRAFEFFSFFFLPRVAALLKFKVFTKKAEKFITDTIEYVMTEREKSGSFRNDLIDTLIALKNRKSGEIPPSKNVLIAQAASFFTAGFETSSSAMTFGLYELAKKPEIQKKLRDEIYETLKKNNNELSYDSIHEMKYLNMVLQEVLRLYPPLPFLDRECTPPRGENSYSLEPYSDFRIPSGMPIFIPIYAIQRDPQYFDNPNEFNPERFSSQNKDMIRPMSNIPFGSGPHICIGERFGVMQAKIGFVHFLKNHRVAVSKNTQPEIKLEPKALLIQAIGGVHLNIIQDPLM